MIADMFQESTMLDIYDKNGAIHPYTASQLKGLTYDEFIQIKEKDLNQFRVYRQIGKTLNFGLLYGLTQKGVIKLLENNNLFYSYKDSCNFHRNWHQTYKQIQIYQKKYINLYEQESKGNIF